jgi:hypothetical protein
LLAGQDDGVGVQLERRPLSAIERKEREVRRAAQLAQVDRCRRSATVFLDHLVTQKSAAVANNHRSALEMHGRDGLKQNLAYLEDNLRELTESAHKRELRSKKR